jgi:hypothetical protein
MIEGHGNFMNIVRVSSFVVFLKNKNICHFIFYENMANLGGCCLSKKAKGLQMASLISILFSEETLKLACNRYTRIIETASTNRKEVFGSINLPDVPLGNFNASSKASSPTFWIACEKESNLIC